MWQISVVDEAVEVAMEPVDLAARAVRVPLVDLEPVDPVARAVRVDLVDLAVKVVLRDLGRRPPNKW